MLASLLLMVSTRKTARILMPVRLTELWAAVLRTLLPLVCIVIMFYGGHQRVSKGLPHTTTDFDAEAEKLVVTSEPKE